MKESLISILFVLFAIPGFSQHLSQEVVSSSGGNGQSTQALLSWTVGEALIQSYGALTQGFQQGELIIDDEFEKNEEPPVTPNEDHTINSYPNPTMDMVMITIKKEDTRGYTYLITDAEGRVLKEEVIANNPEKVDMKDRESGTYFLIVKKEGLPVKKFKIVKQL